MIKKIKQLLLRLILSAIAFIPVMVSAQGSVIPPKPSNLPDVGGGSSNFVDYTLYLVNTYLLPFAGIITVVFIIIGGYRYIFSGGNESQAEAGKKTLVNAIIGLIAIILSFVIVRLVATNLGAK